MNRFGRIRGYGLGLIALAVALSTTGYFLAGQILNRPAQQRMPLVPRTVVTISSARGTLELPVYKVSNPRQLEAFPRQNLKANQGILYRFPQARDDGWTGLGLKTAASVAFLDSQGKILTILDVEPCPTPPQGKGCRSYDPGVVYRQVLEVPRGWFVQNQVEPGALVRVRLPESSQ
ncbi:DUF192 domain-containing protein [Meiothermus hypogaeus]|uniref:DUF192 domain-containing protein n=2 Tax=Meiothermus hypogaeus TaxID=884155 RepID=A0A511R061_9DEIN|nr:DUF192 domain-containing protein [Meiothermus hypogaeus]RIH75965.1 hypothetical protein Mhypo_02698 [Meiothermus hypogaeus]GEM83003.1 hypothetical protein MHY01S_11690 [Meiothermus hypogaeus NBRC 106114]